MAGSSPAMTNLWLCRTNSAVAALPRLRRSRGARGVGNPRQGAAVVHHGVEPVALLLEAGHQRALERAAARQLDAHRIDEAAVDQDFVMHMRASRHAGRADETDHLALPHALAGLHAFCISGHMAVGGLIAVVVFQADVFAVAAFPADLFDHAVAGCEDRRAVRRRPVDAGVHLDIAEDGMAAAAEA